MKKQAKVKKAKGAKSVKKDCSCSIKTSSSCSSGCCSYLLGFIGALIYYISAADSFWIGVLGVLKACIWPAFLVFELLKFLGA